MSKKMLIIGSTGFLGAALTKLLVTEKKSVHTVDKSLFDLNKPISATFEEYFKHHNFQYVIICAAISDVEKCFKDQMLSEQVNVNGMQELLKLAKRNRAIPIFFSSDYVFSGKLTPYSESDVPNPKTVYGHQKLAIELFIQSNFDKYLIFRTSKLMSKTNHPKNIVWPVIQNLKMNRSFKCFEDQLLNPVFVEDIASVIKKAIRQNLTGTYHLGTKQIFTRAELARFLAQSFGYDTKLIESTRMSDMTFSETRPTNNSLNCQSIEKALDFKFCEIRDALDSLELL